MVTWRRHDELAPDDVLEVLLLADVGGLRGHRPEPRPRHRPLLLVVRRREVDVRQDRTGIHRPSEGIQVAFMLT